MDALSDSKLSSPYWALRTTYVLVPLLAGLDKFLNLLTYWPRYLGPAATRLIPFSAPGFMRLAGVVEIAAGVLVLSRFTRFGAYLVTGWLVAIALNLVNAGMYDVAVRDLAMAAGAFALARLEEVRAAGAVRVRRVTAVHA
jgi:hypothetical protein